MRVEVILYQTKLLGSRIGCRQRLAEEGVFFLGALGVDLCQSVTGQRLDGGHQRAGAVLGIGIVFLAHLAALHGLNGNLLANEEARSLIETNHWILWVIGLEI